MPVVRIAVISDDRLLREGLVRILSGGASFSVVGQHDLPTFGAALRAGQPDVLLVDSRMEGALRFCAALRREGGPAVILLAADEDDGFAVCALDAGARGILAKNARAEDLVKAVRVVQEGQIWARRHVLEAWVEHLVGVSGGSRTSEYRLEQRLSSREKEIFRHAATGLSNKELAERLAISQATVKAHLTSIFQKLGLHGRAELAAVYHGLMLSAPDHSSPPQVRRSA
jgi:DNA-binding NarL/FixJ family response regulator